MAGHAARGVGAAGKQREAGAPARCFEYEWSGLALAFLLPPQWPGWLPRRGAVNGNRIGCRQPCCCIRATPLQADARAEQCGKHRGQGRSHKGESCFVCASPAVMPWLLWEASLPARPCVSAAVPAVCPGFLRERRLPRCPCFCGKRACSRRFALLQQPPRPYAPVLRERPRPRCFACRPLHRRRPIARRHAHGCPAAGAGTRVGSGSGLSAGGASTRTAAARPAPAPHPRAALRYRRRSPHSC